MDDEQAIRGLVESWMDATQSGDTAKVLRLMTDDVVFMVPGQKLFGKEAFANRSEQMQDAAIDAKSDILELTVLGNWAYMRSHLTVTMTAHGKTTTRAGNTLTLLRKEHGQWKLARDANLLTVQ